MPVFDALAGSSGSSFEMWTERTPSHPVVHLRGAFNMRNAEPACRQICAAAAMVTPPRIVMDFSEMTEMDCSGLGAVMVIWERLRDVGGLIVLACLPPFFRDLFARLGPDWHLALCDNLAQATALVRRPLPDT
jgi:anti-anti-sigma factor